MSGILENLNQASTAAIAAVLNSLWQTVALVAATWLAMHYTPRMNAATRHLLWWAVLAVILVLPLAPGIAARWQAASPPVVREQAISLPAAPLGVDEETRTSVIHPVSPAPAAPLELRVGMWPLGIVACWSAVLLVQMGRIGWSYRYLREMKQRAHPASPELRRNFDAWMMSCRVHRPARLLVSDEVVSPMAVGFRHPAVILPAPLLLQFQEPEVDHVLLHELAHIARQDDWSNLSARLASAVMVLNPAAAWVLRRIEREREIACDDWVVSMTGAAKPYAASLARLFELCFARRRMLLASGMAGRASHLGERIEMLLHRSREFTPKASAARVALSTLALLALAAAGAEAPRWLALAQEPAAPVEAQEPMPAVAPTPPAAQAAQQRLQRAVPPASVAPSVATTPPAEFAAVAPLPPSPAALSQATTPPPSPRAVVVSTPGSQGSFLAALVAAGYGNLSVDEIINLKNAGVSASYLVGINQAGWGKLSPQEIIELSQRGVSPEYIRKIKDAGIRDMTLKDVVELANFGVRPEMIQEIHSLGFGPYTAKQTIQFAQYGMRPDLFRALKESGLGNAAASEILEAQTVGLNAHDLQEARQYGSSLTLKQIIKLKMAGVI